MNTLINSEKLHLKSLEKNEKELIKSWKKISEVNYENMDYQSGEFKYINRMGRIHAKIQRMANSAENEFLVFGSEKIFMGFHHANILDEISRNCSDSKFLVSTEITSDVLNESKIMFKKTQNELKHNICFAIKDDDEMIYFEENSSKRSTVALWTNSKFTINLTRNLFFSNWS